MPARDPYGSTVITAQGVSINKESQSYRHSRVGGNPAEWRGMGRAITDIGFKPKPSYRPYTALPPPSRLSINDFVCVSG